MHRRGGVEAHKAARRTGAAEERSLDRSVISIVHTRRNTTQKRRTNDKAPFPAGTVSCPPPATLARINKKSDGLCKRANKEVFTRGRRRG
uniref:Uncharacterized protein n=1 Tax=Oryza nivara TaxID=4536 RepID=A0A0E0IBT4_ORYNI